LQLTGKLHIKALEQSLNTVVQRHETLQTTFATLDAQLMQIVTPASTFHLPIIDISGVPEQERQIQLEKLTRQEGLQAFDLANGRVLRVMLVRLEEERHTLLFTMHHIIADGWPMSVFVREVATSYEALAQNRAYELPELSVQYADYTLWQQEWLQGQVLEEQ